MTATDPVRAILIIGPLGSGKTAVAGELGELVSRRGVPVAVVDLDWLGWVDGLAPEHSLDDLILDNLVAVRRNYAGAGVRHLVLTRAIGSADQITGIRRSLDADLQVAALEVSPETATERLHRRDTGTELTHNLDQAVSFLHAMGRLPIDHRVSNEDREVRATAEELLELLGWF